MLSIDSKRSSYHIGSDTAEDSDAMILHLRPEAKDSQLELNEVLKPVSSKSVAEDSGPVRNMDRVLTVSIKTLVLIVYQQQIIQQQTIQ
ncbi:hypothetical protein sscle_16g111100 [Sclerotinia sclerotiorum 1980 UF-70]|uniref:Uncharacterized protein n=1 Tax=Sclerotinia sclerotiorum (strain ATCC 18683 / 1980 / Ss-1) TaxID=665079 RepID=A0A1D9QN32_SCLS1|nr:hypothetical protein sscle_16g111100 [Sclerotinia sclerotiorum 1980 UF-70]